MKKVSFGKGELEFIFENKDEIKSLLEGNILKIPIEEKLGKLAIFSLDKYGGQSNSSFHFDDSEKNILKYEFSPKCLEGFLEKKYKWIKVIQGKSNVCVYGPDSYDNKNYLLQ